MIFKKFILSNLLFVVTTSHFLFAQGGGFMHYETLGKDYIRFGYGYPNLATSTFALGDARNFKESFNPVQFAYYHVISQKVSIGILFNHSQLSKDSLDVVNNKTIKDYKNVYSILFQGHYYHYNNHWVSIYTGFGLGVIVFTGNGSEGNAAGLAFQLDELGIRIGKKIGFYLEGGYGVNGYATGGLSLRF